MVLPGTGSDAEFVRNAFAATLTEHGIETIAVEPDPLGVVVGYRAALDAAAREFGPILVGGVSIGAAVALDWASTNEAAGVLAALPPWIGEPAGAPASLAATATAQQLRSNGIDAVIAELQASSPGWLAETLTRSWRAHWPDLPAALDEAAGYRAPDAALLASLRVPVGIAAATDDPVHPFAVGQRWAELLPRGALTPVTLAEIGADAGVLGAAAYAAFQRA